MSADPESKQALGDWEGLFVKAMQEFLARMAVINDLLCSSSILSWDSRTMMPAGATEVRGQQIATLMMLASQTLVADETMRLIDSAEKETAALAEDSPERRMIAQARDAVLLHRRIPAALQQKRIAIRELSRAAWVEARAKKEFAIFQPWLEQTVELARQLAEAIGYQEHPYDALMSLFEPGETVRSLEVLFDRLRAGLLPLIRATQQNPMPRWDFLTREYAPEKQKEFALRVAVKLGYDLNHGRLDETVHPFEVSFTREDVRITTRVMKNYLPAAMFGVWHEAGHGLYEQQVNPAYTRTPLATDLGGLYAVGGVSFGAHESQSRLYENHIARSRSFWRLHFAALQQSFPEQLRDVTDEEFYRAVNRVKPSLIRVEADEVTYDLHVILRTEIESRMIAGQLAVKDLPEYWNAVIKRDLGVEVPDDGVGVLQDIHWSGGQIGTFCNYTIGNVMAAQLMETAQSTDTAIPPALDAGNYQPLLKWLGEHVHQHGRRFSREELLVKATGRGLDPEPYIRYLTRKCSDVYELPQ